MQVRFVGALVAALLGCAEKAAVAPVPPPAGQVAPQAVPTASSQPQATKPTVRDEPATCIAHDTPQEVQNPEAAVQEMVRAGIAELGACARTLRKPTPVLVRVRFNSDGSVGAVSIPRAATDDCGAIDCVRQRLAALKGPRSDWGSRGGADFLLRSQPPPDASEPIRWDPKAESTKCTDQKIGDYQSRSAESLAEKIRSRYTRFLACYSAGLEVDPQLRGRVQLRLVISPRGLVAKARVVANELTNCEVSACLRREASQLLFETSDDADTVTVPFAFAPNDSPAGTGATAE